MRKLLPVLAAVLFIGAGCYGAPTEVAPAPVVAPTNTASNAAVNAPPSMPVVPPANAPSNAAVNTPRNPPVDAVVTPPDNVPSGARMTEEGMRNCEESGGLHSAEGTCHCVPPAKLDATGRCASK